MKVTFDGKTYDTESAEQEATFITYSNTPHDLYRTGDGEFFLVLDDYILDGRRLGPMECLDELAPEICVSFHPNLGGKTESEATERWQLRERARRLREEKRLVPVTNKEALIWCIKTQIPQCLRGYLLDCL